MGSGSWVTKSFENHYKSRGMDYDGSTGTIRGAYKAQDMFKANRISNELNPYNVIRECCDSEEHPQTIPVILGLDVTGSMGDAAVEVAKKLNIVMTELLGKVKDVEFMVMGIGDLAYDSAPIQVSQFESDIRIAEHLDKIYFEFGGGGNGFESYTAAWYIGSRHTQLDCWKRGKRGVIITMGDEPLNPYLPLSGRNCGLIAATGDKLQGDIETADLYSEVIEKFDVYHLAVNARSSSYTIYSKRIEESFGKYLDDKHLRVVSLDNIAANIVDIVTNANLERNMDNIELSKVNKSDLISW